MYFWSSRDLWSRNHPSHQTKHCKLLNHASSSHAAPKICFDAISGDKLQLFSNDISHCCACTEQNCPPNSDPSLIIKEMRSPIMEHIRHAKCSWERVSKASSNPDVSGSPSFPPCSFSWDSASTMLTLPQPSSYGKKHQRKCCCVLHFVKMVVNVTFEYFTRTFHLKIKPPGILVDELKSFLGVGGKKTSLRQRKRLFSFSWSLFLTLWPAFFFLCFHLACPLHFKYYKLDAWRT